VHWHMVEMHEAGQECPLHGTWRGLHREGEDRVGMRFGVD
jgi:hypothetical protein